MPTKEVSKEHFRISGRNVRQMPIDVAMDAVSRAPRQTMEHLGIGYANPSVAARVMSLAREEYGFGMDAFQQSVTPAAIPSLAQFLQNWLPGQVHVMTAEREADNIMGISTIGNWEDEQIVQELLENIGYAKPYTDNGNLPLSDWNQVYVPRTVIRFELGMRVNNLEEARSARVRVNSSEAKRQSAGLALEIVRNLVGFNGYNSGNDNTYGFLNDPGLLPYETVAGSGTGAPTTLWSGKTFLEICADIRTAIVQLRTQSKGVINPQKLDLTLALPTNAIDYLTVTSDFGISVWDWLKQTYPRIRVQDAIQLDTASGNSVGDGAFYLFADRVNDLSTDDGRTWIQVVPAKFMVQGVAKMVKGYEEGYLNATAGAMCKRPWAVTRWVGIS